MKGRALMIPDIHFGFRRVNEEWVPLHDVKAVQAALEMAADIKCTEVVILGDICDFAELGKFVCENDLLQTTQRSLDEAHLFLQRLRDIVGPKCKITLIEGNHEARAEKKLLECAPQFSQLKAAGSDIPAISIQNLLGLDALNINYVGPYKAVYWLFGCVRVTHGQICKKRGGQAEGASLVEYAVHQVAGHTHKMALACRTVHGPKGPEVLFAMNPGTLARIDGIVPSGGTDHDWQQSCGIVFQDTDGQIFMSLVPIINGRYKLRNSY